MKFGTQMTMTNKGTFEKHGKSHACRLCGQYIEVGQQFGLIVVPLPWAKEQRNFFVHAEEWEAHCEGLETAEEIFFKLSGIVQPKALNKTAPEPQRVEAFRRVLRKKGALITKETANRIYFKLSKETSEFYLEKRFEKIVDQSRKSGIFDQIFMKEIISRLNEDWLKELGEPTGEPFRAEKIFEEAANRITEIIG